MKISKRGNGLAFRLPKKLAKDLGLREGDDLDITAADAQTIVISKNDGKGDVLLKLRVSRGTRPDPGDANTR